MKGDKDHDAAPSDVVAVLVVFSAISMAIGVCIGLML